MGHDLHFLERLSRASPGHADLALALYRDPGVVRFLLGYADLPEGAERVAVALGPPGAGPHVVVARDGHFVTCLGEGMKTSDLPIISRAKLDAALAQTSRLRERFKALDDVAPGERDLVALFRRFGSGALVSREDVLAGLALWHLVQQDYGRNVGVAMKEYNLAELRATRRGLGPDFEADQRHFWDIAWSVAHYTLLAFAEPDALAPDFLARIRDLGIDPTTTGCSSVLIASHVRGIWAANRGAKHWLPLLKAGAAKGQYGQLCALACVALGHRKLAAEATKAIERAEDEPVRNLLLELLAHPDVWHERHLEFGRRTVVHWTKDFPEDSQWRFSRAEDVPESLASAALTAVPLTIRDDDGLLVMLEAIPFLARARPEELYLPADLLRQLGWEWRPALTEKLLGPEEHRRKATAPVVAAPAVGRNDPCPCGSGRKSKKCCGK